MQKLISRFYLENYLSFNQIDLEFNKGLIVFTGASGTGKSVLMSSILSLFGNSDAKAKLSEILIEDLNITNDSYSISKNSDIVIKQITQNKSRYLLNNQTISKRNLKDFTSNFSSYLHLKDTSDFDSDKIVEFLDILSSLNDKSYKLLLEEYILKYKDFKIKKAKLDKLLKDELEIENLIEFTKFEIDKITKINPEEDEYEELKKIKTNISKKDKVEDILKNAQPFLNNTQKITSALKLLDVDSTFFDDAINEVNNIFEKFNDELNAMQDINVEDILDRIEKLSSLIKRFGGIQEAIDYKKEKIKELDIYENLSFEKAILEKNVLKAFNEIDEIANKISKIRKENISLFTIKINKYLEYLYLENLTIEITKKNIDITGIDFVNFKLNGISLNKISSGEFNRLRLALLTARCFYEINTNGILFLDEIDANLSGKESQSIAKVLNELSKNYQIFAISHQPQLSATANQHFLVTKVDNISTVKLLNTNEKISEIARMISGEKITKEAIEFATELLK